MADAVHDAKRLLELQALPLERKIQISQARIIEWYKHYDGKVVVSFSGGKDSTVLLHMVRQLYPGVKAVFSNTGLEYASIQRHVKTFDNVDIIVPPMRFDQVISMYGYPLISKEVAEAIYYARRIRSQNGKVERERAEQRAANGENSADRDSTAARESREEKVTERLRNRGGVETRPSESDRRSSCHQTEKYSHPDERCKEQTNRLERETDWHDWRRGCL